MRIIALSLVTVFGLGAAVVGGRGIAADGASHSYTNPAVAETPVWRGGTLAPIVVLGTAPTNRVWYGGTLAPIVVEATLPVHLSGSPMSDCEAGGH